MEASKERIIAQLELETQEYSVFITDEKRTSSGSGVLFYPGSGSNLYIFTCAHVLDNLEEPFQIYSLLPLNREQELYRVEKLEAMTPDERFAFWRGELSRCIRCNACRNVCPACSCENCVFDNPKSGISNKAAADSFEENMFHIIRAFHVAGRCTDCGECSRVCPQNIPLHLLNRKFIKDINTFYGEYQAGADAESRAPLNIYNTEDVEPSIVYEKGGNR